MPGLRCRGLRCWGANWMGQLGDGTNNNTGALQVAVLNLGNPSWPALITVVATGSACRASSVNVTFTDQ